MTSTQPTAYPTQHCPATDFLASSLPTSVAIAKANVLNKNVGFSHGNTITHSAIIKQFLSTS
jgi:hypothetical protein